MSRRRGQTPLYAGYVSTAVIIPKGSQNNRVIAAGAEDIQGADGRKARLFLVGTRPGMAYETGTQFAPAVQIGPILPANVRFALRYPDGREKVAEGVGDKLGGFVGAERWLLDVPGVYRYTLVAEWQGHKGYMPGLPAEGGDFYVYDGRPAGATGLRLALPGQSLFPAASGLKIVGTSSAPSVRCAVIMPGCVIAQPELPVVNGKFQYTFNPAAVQKAVPIYDNLNLKSGKPELGRVVHITFCSREVAPGGATFYDFARVILRGNQAISTR